MSDRVEFFQFNKDQPERLDRFLVSCLPEFSRSRLQGLIADGFVEVNGKTAVKGGQPLEGNGEVVVRIPPPVPSKLEGESIPLDIIFENDDLMVVNKPAGMVVHPAAGHDSGNPCSCCVGI